MVDERDVSRETEWFLEERVSTVITNLGKRAINAQYVPTRQEALAAVMAMIPEGATVNRGDSVTLEQIGVIDELTNNPKYKFTNPMARKEDGNFIVDNETRIRQQREAFFADVFLAGTNAVTLDGKLVNIDGYGNRVAAMVFGPTKVILVVGVNKIVKDVDEALERIHNWVAPINYHRHIHKHHMTEFSNLPCIRTGKCANCSSKWSGCLYTMIIQGTFSWFGAKGRINVVLVGEELGY